MCSTTLSICSWNVRGLGDDQKCSDVLAELFAVKPHIALLQESKLESISNQKLRSFLPNSLDQVVLLPSVGSAGGTVSAANSSHFSLLSHLNHNFASTIIVKTLAYPRNVAITNIYAPSCRTLKKDFLDELLRIKQDDDMPWLIVGDFNLLRFSSDKNTSSFRKAEADAFNQVLNDLALIELPLLDRRFTWSNKRSSPTLERIDRAFINLAWDSAFPNTTLTSLTRFTSDHVPLIVHVNTLLPRNSQFKYEPAWGSYSSAINLVTPLWPTQQLGISPNSASLLAKTLKCTRSKLKRWACSRLNANLHECNCKRIISLLDLREEQHQLYPAELQTRLVVINVLQKALKEKVLAWRLRAKI